MAAEARTYVVGLPVIVEVDEHGAVTFEVDLSEAATSLADDDEAAARYPDEVLTDDAMQVHRAALEISSHIATKVGGRLRAADACRGGDSVPGARSASSRPTSTTSRPSTRPG